MEARTPEEFLEEYELHEYEMLHVTYIAKLLREYVKSIQLSDEQIEKTLLALQKNEGISNEAVNLGRAMMVIYRTQILNKL